MIEKILSKIREQRDKYADLANSSNFDGWAQEEKEYLAKEEACEELIEIVQETAMAKEYGNASDNDLTVVSALPSLYPLQPFEKEAIHKVVASAKDGGWIPCSERLPQENEPVESLCQVVNITLKNGTVTVGWCNRFLEKWYVSDEHCVYPIPCKYEDVLAWMPLPSKYEPLPAPYQKGE